MAKRPYVREWHHEGKPGGDTYSQKPATKAMIAKAVELQKKGHDIVICSSGRLLKGHEWSPSAFLKTHPKWKIKPKKKAKKKR
jgi:hypothetical protein